MEQIGKTVAAVLEKASGHSRSLAPVKPQAGSQAPTTVDRHCDVVLPARLFSGWIPSDGPREIVRPLAAHERAALEVRAGELREAMTPCQPHQAAGAEAAIAAMFNGFRSMRQQGDDVEATVRVSRHILREFPLWAITRACLAIAQGGAGLDRRWPPNDAELYGVVKGMARFHDAALHRCEALLYARVEDQEEPTRPTKAEIDEQVAQLKLSRQQSEWDGNYMARVLADLAARKANAEAAE